MDKAVELLEGLKLLRNKARWILDDGFPVIISAIENSPEALEEVETAGELIYDLKAELGKLKEENETLESRIEELETIVEERWKKIEKMKEENETLFAYIEELEGKLDAAE